MFSFQGGISRVAAAVALSAAALGAAPHPAAAQYFGRNKVQYQSFDFRVLKTDHFDIYYYPQEQRSIADAARMAERWYARQSRIFDHEFEDRQPLIIYADAVDFRQTSTSQQDVGEGTGGFTDVFKRRVVLPFAGPYRETDHVIGHELVHAFQFDIAGFGNNPGGVEGVARRFQVPLWFTEGMAEYVSVGPVDPNTAMWLRDAALSGNIPSIQQLTRDPRYFPYRWGQAFWAYVGGRWGDAVIGQLLKQVAAGIPYDEAFQRILNEPLDEIGKDWAGSIRQAYLPLLTEQREAREIAGPLVVSNTQGGRLNLGPALSPDGKYFAFLSSRDNLDIQLYLADARTGKVIRTLQKGTAFDAHYQSLNFINSAGTFSPDGRRFAFSAVRGGEEVIVVLDTGSGKRTREYKLRGVGQLTSPSWSPDGRSIAVSGMQGGVMNLYLVDTSTGGVRQLTDDAFAEMQPAFSPDGGTLAFVTDRGPGSTGTNFQTLNYGIYRVALLDVATGAIRFLPGMEGSKNIDPQWAGDGRSIFFISNRTGIPNVYRLAVDGSSLTRVTNLFGGVSGITDLSPALAVAQGTDRLVFTAYERSGYNLYTLAGAQLTGTPLPRAFATPTGDTIPVYTTVAQDTVPRAAVLPPVPRPAAPAFNRVANALENEQAGLPPASADTGYAVAPYRPRLTLDYLGQPQIGFSTGGGYSRGGVYGGVNGIFSDILGYNQVYAAVVAQGQLDEIGGLVQYINTKHRLNWGAVVQRIPMIFQGYGGVFADTSRGVLVQRFVRQRFFDSAVRGLLQYPFSRVQRVEFTAGARRFSYDYQFDDFLYDPITRQRISDRQGSDLPGSSYNLGEVSAALVFDNSLSGYTSPFAGQRYRFQISPTFGDLNYYQALADARKYFFFRPFTVAVRGVHLGRYGQNAQPVAGQFNPLTQSFLLGQPYFIRGYNYYAIYQDCVNQRVTECRLLNETFGSRIGVGNVELRYPLLNAVGSSRASGFPPVELLAFYDAGIAWNKGQSPVFGRGIQANLNESGFLTSAGVGARINLFGYFVAEVDYLRAFERDNRWRWQFALQPGF